MPLLQYKVLVYTCMFDGLIGEDHNHLYHGMKQGKVLSLPCLFLFNSLLQFNLVQSNQKDSQEPKRVAHRLVNIFQNIFPTLERLQIF